MSDPRSRAAQGEALRCIHCSDVHPAEWSHCPRTGKALGTGPALVGRTIEGRYRIVGILGEGGMGAVYAAEHLLLGRRVALKRLHPELASDEAAVTRFQREARAAAATGHEHIVEILDMGYAEDGAPFLVMEYLTGENLAQTLRRETRLAPSRACYVVGQILAGLEAVHEKSIVHRDLKPDNVFLTRKGGRNDYVKLLDFGVSKMRAADGSEPNPLTRTGVMMGTPHYMSPEQASGTRTIDHRVDLYAVGVILYESLAGVLPFDGPNYHALLQAILLSSPRPLESLVPSVPPELAQVVHRAITRDVRDRYATARDMLRALVPFGAVETRKSPSSVPAPTFTRAPLRPLSIERVVSPSPRTHAAATPRSDVAPTVHADVVALVHARDGIREGFVREESPDLARLRDDRPGPFLDRRPVVPSENAPRPQRYGAPRRYAAMSSDWDPDIARRARPRLSPRGGAIEPVTPPPAPPTPTPTEARLARIARPAAQVRGTLVMAALDHVRTTFGERELERLKKQLAPATAEPLARVILPMAWIAQSIFDDLLEAAHATLGSTAPDLTREIGRTYATRDVPTTYRLLLLGATPAMCVQRFPALWQASHDTGSLVVSPLEGGGFALDPREFGSNASFHLEAMAGFFARVVEFAGARDARCDVVQRGRGERAALHVRWR